MVVINPDNPNEAGEYMTEVGLHGGASPRCPGRRMTKVPVSKIPPNLETNVFW